MKTLCSQKLENGNTDLLLLQIQDTQVPLSGQKYSKTKKICTSKLKTIMHSHKTRKPVEESREHAGCWLPTTLSARCSIAPLDIAAVGGLPFKTIASYQAGRGLLHAFSFKI